MKIKKGFPGGTSSEEPTCQCRKHKRCGFNPWSGRSPGGGHVNPLQYACLENAMERGAWRAKVHRVAEMNTTEGTWHAHTRSLENTGSVMIWSWATDANTKDHVPHNSTWMKVMNSSMVLRNQSPIFPGRGEIRQKHKVGLEAWRWLWPSLSVCWVNKYIQPMKMCLV